MSPFYTTFLSKSDFSFALLLVTFEPLDIQQSYIPLLKALKCGINAVGAQGRGCSSLLCHAHLKMGVLLHKQATGRFILILAVNETYQVNFSSHPVGGFKSILFRSQNPAGNISGEEAW